MTKSRDVYIRRLKISGLFGSDGCRTIDFSNGTNCIFGANGSGKTTIINLLVAVLNVDTKRLGRLRFSEIIVFCAKNGQRRPIRFITVHKRGPTEIFFVTNDGVENRLVGDSGEVLATNQVLLREHIKQQISLIHLPLNRINEGDIGFGSPRDRDIWMHSIVRSRDVESEEIDLLLDPVRRMLVGLERSFKDLFSRKQRVIREELEILKTKVMEKLLIDDTLHKNLSLAPNINKPIKADDYKTAKQKFDEIGLRLPTANLEKHFSIMADVQNELLAIRAEYIQFNKTNETDQKKANDLSKKYGDIYRLHTSIHPFHIRLMSILSDVEKSTDYRMNELNVFRQFEKTLNSFLVNKLFTFSDVGGFHFSCSGNEVKLEDLSSGEKHLLALLGKVSLSEINGSIFIADEPELSLHLAWQRKLLPSISELAPSMQIIVATHAPAIIPNSANKIDLDEVENG